MKNIFQSENCLSLDTMRMYKDGKLTARNAHAVEKHLLECSLCSEAFDSLDVRRMAEVEKVSTRVNRRLATYMNTPPRVGFFQRFGLAITAGTLILATGGGIALWMHNQEKPQITDSAQQQQNNATLVSQAQETAGQPETFAQENPQDEFRSSDGENPGNPADENNTAGVKKKETKQQPDNNTSAPVNNTRQPEPVTTSPKGSENTTPPPVNPDNNTRTPATDPVVVKSSRLTMKVSANANDDETATGKMSNGQFVRENKKKKNEQTLDQMPQFPEGDWNINEYILSKFRPLKIDRAELKNYTAMVIVTVSSKGKVTNVEMMRGIHKDIDAEIVRVLKGMPAWTTGKGDIDATLVVTVE